jgi:hypothetical protein
VAGSIPGKKIHVIDQKTEEMSWTVPTEEACGWRSRPTLTDHPAIFRQISNINGFQTVDFAHKIVGRLRCRKRRPAKK